MILAEGIERERQIYIPGLSRSRIRCDRAAMASPPELIDLVTTGNLPRNP